MNSTIKVKVGDCADCGWNGPLCAKRCQNCYKRHRNTVNGQKAGKSNRNTPIAKKSALQVDREIKYAKIRKAWLPDHPACEAKVNRCQGAANQVHHMEGRSGDLLFDTAKWLACCHNCHQWITEHSAEAIARGLSFRRNN